MCNIPKQGWKKVIRGKWQEELKKPEAPSTLKFTVSLLLGPFHVLGGQQERDSSLSAQSIWATLKGCLSTSLVLKSKVMLGLRLARFACVQFLGVKLDGSSQYTCMDMCKFLFFKGVLFGHL